MQFLVNQNIPILERAFQIIDELGVVLMEYGRAIVFDGQYKYFVNFTSETCTCDPEIKCEHIWAAQMRQKQLTEGLFKW